MSEAKSLQKEKYSDLPRTREGIPYIACHAIGGYPLPKWKQALLEIWGVLTRYHPTWALGHVDVKGTKRKSILRFREWRRTEEGRNASRSVAALMKEIIREEVENEFLKSLERNKSGV